MSSSHSSSFAKSCWLVSLRSIHLRLAWCSLCLFPLPLLLLHFLSSLTLLWDPLPLCGLPLLSLSPVVGVQPLLMVSAQPLSSVYPTSPPHSVPGPCCTRQGLSSTVAWPGHNVAFVLGVPSQVKTGARGFLSAQPCPLLLTSHCSVVSLRPALPPPPPRPPPTHTQRPLQL